MIDRICKYISVIFHPLLVPTYAICMFCHELKSQYPEIASRFFTLLICSTFVFTFIIPVLSIILLRRGQGVKNSLLMRTREERQTPYHYTLIAIGVWGVFLFKALPSLPVIPVLVLGGWTALAIITAINRKWLISAHSTAAGIWTAAVAGYAVYMNLQIPVIITEMLCLSLLIMLARLRLNAHTPAQVVAGFLIGLSTTFLFVWIFYCL